MKDITHPLTLNQYLDGYCAVLTFDPELVPEPKDTNDPFILEDFYNAVRLDAKRDSLEIFPHDVYEYEYDIPKDTDGGYESDEFELVGPIYTRWSQSTAYDMVSDWRDKFMSYRMAKAQLEKEIKEDLGEAFGFTPRNEKPF